jgi:hypothetical protein
LALPSSTISASTTVCLSVTARAVASHATWAIVSDVERSRDGGASDVAILPSTFPQGCAGVAAIRPHSWRPGRRPAPRPHSPSRRGGPGRSGRCRAGSGLLSTLIAAAVSSAPLARRASCSRFCSSWYGSHTSTRPPPWSSPPPVMMRPSGRQRMIQHRGGVGADRRTVAGGPAGQGSRHRAARRCRLRWAGRPGRLSAKPLPSSPQGAFREIDITTLAVKSNAPNDSGGDAP